MEKSLLKPLKMNFMFSFLDILDYFSKAFNVLNTDFALNISLMAFGLMEQQAFARIITSYRV